MQAGRLRYIVVIQERISTKDQYGAEQFTWSTAYTVRADVRFKSGMKQVEDKQLFNAQSIEMYIRYRSDITEAMRVQFDGRVYKIISINETAYRHTLKLEIERITEGA